MLLFHPLSSPTLTAFSTERHAIAIDAPYEGMNITSYTGDDVNHVAACRERLCQQLGIAADRLFLPRQVHGTRIVEVTSNTLPEDLEGVDALITALPDVCIGISTADCVPLLMHDRRTDAIAAVHAGWRGTVARIGVLALTAMHDAFDTRPEDVECAIGPSIGPEAFEVGDEVYEAFAAAAFPMEVIAYRPESKSRRVQRPFSTRRKKRQTLEKWHIDLWKANAWQLERAGVRPENIHTAAICSYQHYDRFFSARRLGINSGRTYSGIIRRTVGATQEPSSPS